LNLYVLDSNGCQDAPDSQPTAVTRSLILLLLSSATALWREYWRWRRQGCRGRWPL